MASGQPDLAAAGDLDFEVLPSTPYAVLAPEQAAEIVAAVFQHDFADPDEWIPVDDGAELEWTVTAGDGSLSTATSTTDEGYASTRLTTTTVPEDSFRVEGRLKSFRFRDAPVNLERVSTRLASESAEIVVLPGVPATVAVSPSTTSYAADSTATVTLTAVVTDAAGNAVADATRVAWSVDRSTEDFVRRDATTLGGVATAELLAPALPVDQQIAVRSGPVSEAVLIDVARVAGTLESSDASLDMRAEETATLTATVNASDGTPVFWLASNGTITPTTSAVSDGRGTATLSTEGGCPGPVVVTATIGERMLHWEGALVSSHRVWMSVENRYLVADAIDDGFTSHTRPDGTLTQAPFFAATGVTIHGGAGEIAFVQVPEQDPFEAYSFDGLVAGEVPGLIGGHPLALDGARIDPVASAGAASLLFEPGDGASVEASGELDFEAGWGVSLSLRPAAFGPATVAAKTGSWSIDLSADGRVSATVTTDAGTFAVASTEPVDLGVWNETSIEATEGSLLLFIRSELHSEVVENRDFSGQVIASDSILELGGGYSGHLDELTLYDVFAPVPYQLEGLAAGRRIALGLDGTALFAVRSRGTLEIDDYTARPFTIGVSVAALPSGFRSPLGSPGKNAGGESTATATMFFVNQPTWEIFGDIVGSFFGGDPETTAGTLANVAGGMLVVGDVGAIVKNAWRMFGFSEKAPNSAELILSGLGIVTEFWVGFGEILDVPISAARAIVARIGNSPFAEVLANRLKKIFTRGEAPSQDEIDVLKLLQLDETGELLQPINRLVDSEDLWKTVAAICKRADALPALQAPAGSFEKTPGLHRRLIGEIDTVTSSYSKQAGEDVARVLEIMKGTKDVPLSAYDNLLRVDPDDLKTAIDGLGKTLHVTKVPHVWLGWIASSRNIITPAYNEARFFTDLGKLAEADGLVDLLKRMDSDNVRAIGFRYEMEVAVAELFGVKARFLKIGAPLVVPEFRNLSDIDLLFRDVAVQAKSSIPALRSYQLERVEHWIQAAKAFPGIQRVIFVLPPGGIIPSSFDDLFERSGVEVLRIPHLLD